MKRSPVAERPATSVRLQRTAAVVGTMLKSLAHELRADGLLDPDDQVVVAASGGPDSMALLHLLIGLNESLDWKLRLHIAHLNHGIRGDEGEKDAAFVQAAADSRIT